MERVATVMAMVTAMATTPIIPTCHMLTIPGDARAPRATQRAMVPAAFSLRLRVMITTYSWHWAHPVQWKWMWCRK